MIAAAAETDHRQRRRADGARPGDRRRRSWRQHEARLRGGSGPARRRSPPSRPGEALKAVGMALVMKVGGASGPLYGSLFMAMGKALGDRPLDAGAACPRCFAAGVDAVSARGKSTAGEKTMLDVLDAGARSDRAPAGPVLRARLRGRRRARRRRHDPDARDQGPRRLSRRAERRPYGSWRAVEPDHRRNPVVLPG